jgi:hypothetical protein
MAPLQGYAIKLGLVIMLPPHVVRSPRHSDHTPMMHVDPNYQTR